MRSRLGSMLGGIIASCKGNLEDADAKLGRVRQEAKTRGFLGLAHRAALLILEEFNVEWLRLSIKKPGAILHSKDVGVSVLRTRAALGK